MFCAATHQALCDPLWKRLSPEEKARYKEMKKSLRKQERETRVMPRIPQGVRRVEFEGRRWRVAVARVESPELIWVVPDPSDPRVQCLMIDLEAAPLQVTPSPPPWPR